MIAILSPTILERFWNVVFNHMCDDAEFALETPVFCLLPIPHTYTTRNFRKIIFHKVRKGWSEWQGHSGASLHRMRCERRALCLMLHLKCAVWSVCISLTNALRSHHLCGLECSGLIYLKYEPHLQKAAFNFKCWGALCLCHAAVHDSM